MQIEKYSFGNIVIDSSEYTSDVLIIEDKIINWWRREGHLLQVVDLEEVFKYVPDILFVGCGASGLMKVDKDVERRCVELGIELKVGKTSTIVEEFNSTKGRKVACGLHLTC